MTLGAPRHLLRSGLDDPGLPDAPRRLPPRRCHRQHPRGGTLGTLALRTGSLATLFTTATFLGSTAFFLPSSNRAALFLTEDWPRIFTYGGAAWTLTFVWCSLAVALLHVTRSQLWTSLVVVAFQAGYFWLSKASDSGSLPQLVHRSFVTWNFTGILTPYGFSPPLLAVQALCFVAIGCALLGGSLALGRPNSAPHAPSLRRAQWLGATGAVVAAGAVAATAWALGRQVAPFRVAELVNGHAAWDRPYVWSADYRFLAYANPCIALVWVPPILPLRSGYWNPPKRPRLLASGAQDGGAMSWQAFGRPLQQPRPQTCLWFFATNAPPADSPAHSPTNVGRAGPGLPALSRARGASSPTRGHSLASG